MQPPRRRSIAETDARPRRAGAKAAQQSKARAPRLSREDWVDGAIALLSEGGLTAFEITPLAARLGVTKGSFYHHFETREDLLQAAVDTWHRRTTEEIEGYVRSWTGTPAERLQRLVRVGLQPRPDVPGGGFELTLRDWGRRDAAIARLVSAVDAHRLAFLRELYGGVCASREQAEIYAFAHMSLIMGGRILLSGADHDSYDFARNTADRFLLPPDA